MINVHKYRAYEESLYKCYIFCPFHVDNLISKIQSSDMNFNIKFNIFWNFVEQILTIHSSWVREWYCVPEFLIIIRKVVYSYLSAAPVNYFSYTWLFAVEMIGTIRILLIAFNCCIRYVFKLRRFDQSFANGNSWFLNKTILQISSLFISIRKYNNVYPKERISNWIIKKSHHWKNQCKIFDVFIPVQRRIRNKSDKLCISFSMKSWNVRSQLWQ